MDNRIELLRDWGCDIENALNRMLKDEGFYIECLESVAHDACFSELKTSIEQNNIQKAFDCAHTLKGVLSNVGLTPMLDKVVEIVEPLRAGQLDNLEVKCDELNALLAHLNEILGK